MPRPTPSYTVLHRLTPSYTVCIALHLPHALHPLTPPHPLASSHRHTLAWQVRFSEKQKKLASKEGDEEGEGEGEEEEEEEGGGGGEDSSEGVQMVRALQLEPSPQPQPQPQP